ncbi:MAG TPA: VanZ family protein [Terriglobia bacterium]|nr:VanZ family protein [Terriglobia bacterium]
MENELPQPALMLRWAITLAWAALIFFLSTRTYAPSFTRPMLASTFHFLHIYVSGRTFNLLHALLRKLAHLTEYGIFALLLNGLPSGKSPGNWRPRRAVYCILGAALYSLTDEFHQWFVPGRHASLLDCGFDTLGAGLAMLIPYAQERLSFLKSSKIFQPGPCPVNPHMLIP